MPNSLQTECQMTTQVECTALEVTLFTHLVFGWKPKGVF